MNHDEQEGIFVNPKKSCYSKYEHKPGKFFDARACPFLREEDEGFFRCLRTGEEPEESCPLIGNWIDQVDAWNADTELVDDYGEIDLFTGLCVVECPSCFDRVLESDLDYCAKCGQEVCDSCMEFSDSDPDSPLCSECSGEES